MAFLAEHTAGKDVTLKAFSSASLDPNGYVAKGRFVAHLVIDGETGRDISESFGDPVQQEVVYLPEAAIHI